MIRVMASPFSIRAAGVTLIELVVTIALVAIISVMILQFATPVRAYIDTSRRAALTHIRPLPTRRSPIRYIAELRALSASPSGQREAAA